MLELISGIIEKFDFRPFKYEFSCRYEEDGFEIEFDVESEKSLNWFIFNCEKGDFFIEQNNCKLVRLSAHNHEFILDYVEKILQDKYLEMESEC